MIYVTDAISKNRVAINTAHVVAVFKIPDGEQAGKTGVNLVNGSIICDEEDYEIVGLIKGQD
jgi:hypothetical protein